MFFEKMTHEKHKLMQMNLWSQRFRRWVHRVRSTSEMKIFCFFTIYINIEIDWYVLKTIY